MNVFTHETNISKSEIENLIELLGKPYEDFELDVHVFGSFEIAETIIAKMLSPFETAEETQRYLLDVASGVIGGTHFCSDEESPGWRDLIFLYEFSTCSPESSLSKVEAKKIDLALDLFHEFRHAFQYDRLGYEPFLLEEFEYDGVPYNERPLEADANFFAFKTAKQFSSEINNILDLKAPPWLLPFMSIPAMKVIRQLEAKYPALFEKKIVLV